MGEENIFDKYGYIAYPITILEFSNELKKAIDDYRARKINNKEIEEIVKFYAYSQPDKLFDGAKLNITVQRICGKKRIEVINSFLNGYQQRL